MARRVAMKVKGLGPNARKVTARRLETLLEVERSASTCATGSDVRDLGIYMFRRTRSVETAYLVWYSAKGSGGAGCECVNYAA